MTELAFSVTDRKVTRTDTARIVGDSIDEYTAEFTLDAMWTESIITSVWVKGGEAYKAILTDGVCNVPNEVLVGYGEVTVSLYAGDLRTTVSACVWVEKSGYIEGVTPATPTPSEYAQIVEAYNSKADKADTYTETEIDTMLGDISAGDIAYTDTYETGADNAQDIIDILISAFNQIYAAYDGKQSKPLVFTDVVVSAWEEDTTYTGYGYKATIPLTGATADRIPHVYFSGTDAISGNYAPPPESYNGGVYIYGKVDDGITVPLIVLEATS